MPALIERHWDQVITVTGTLAAGKAARQVPMKIDASAPFVLRSIGAYKTATLGSPSLTLAGGQLDFYDFRRANFQSMPTGMTATGALPSLLTDMPDGGRNNLFSPVWRHTIYPANADLVLDLFNNSADDWTNPTFIFRGVQLYTPGMVYAPTYPDCYQSQPFIYPLTQTIPDTTPINRIKILVQDDAAFACRGLLISPDPAGAAQQYNNLFIRLYDRDNRYYANDWINIDWLFSREQGERPGLVYPEFYIPQNENLYFDLQCTDGDGSLTVDLAFDGAKVYPMTVNQQ
jgi:hypothetical protein